MNKLPKVKDRVIDSDGFIGTVVEVQDEHNIHVVYDSIRVGRKLMPKGKGYTAWSPAVRSTIR